MGEKLYSYGIYKLDEKGRIFLPAKNRHVFGEEALLTVWPGPSLILIPPKNFPELEERYFSGIDFLEKGIDEKQAMKLGKFKNIIYSFLTEQKIDKSGRILIPKEHLEYANISKEARIVGYGLYYRIWDPDLYRQSISEPLEEFKSLPI
ncbi:MAG: hypothetical protein N2440_01945 [Actinobacteria bacterium]|nr:hypothetical protein [Actinomycetota bacterium]